MKKCIVENCIRKQHARTYCNIHYYRLIKWNDINKEPRPKKTLEEKRKNIQRIKAKYKKTIKGIESEKKYKQSEIGKATRRAWVSTRRKRTKKATPNWINKKQIKEIYKNCPEGFEVDHIIPLKAIHPVTKKHIACGLHVPWNLQYLPKIDNNLKSNKIPKEFLCTLKMDL